MHEPQITENDDDSAMDEALLFLEYFIPLILNMFDYRIEYLLTQIFWLLIYYILFAFVRGIYRNCIRIPKNLKTRYSQPSVPVWACITGATSGIGL